MENILNKIFDDVVCINLVERKEKKDFMQAQFDKFGIHVNWFQTVKYGFAPIIANSVTLSKQGFFNLNQPNEVGCALSHYTVIKKAYLEGKKNLFIFEDDAVLHNDFNNKFKTYYEYIPKDWDLLMLYSYLPGNYTYVDIDNLYWTKASKNWSNVAIGINRNFMEKFIHIMDNFFCVADLPTFKLQEELKGYLVKDFLVMPSEKLNSDIRLIKNYQILQKGINKNNFL